MRAGSVIVMLVLLAAVWWQTDQLSEARTRNKLLTETATGYDQLSRSEGDRHTNP